MKAKHGIRDNEKEQKAPSHIRIKSLRGRIRELFFDAKHSPEQIAKALDLDVQDVRITINKMRL